MAIRGRGGTAIAIIGIGCAGSAAGTAQGLALESTGQALADAGYAGGRGLNPHRAGVIIGTTLAGPGALAAGDATRAAEAAGRPRGPAGDPAADTRPMAPVLTAETMPPTGTGTGTGPGTIAGEICARFGLRGAGHTVDGSRFSSLIAIAAGCSALAAGDLDFVLAGGVDTGPGPGNPDGAGGAAGVRHGCGVVALMRASDAAVAGTPLYAEITGWGMCADAGPGKTHAGRVRTATSLLGACEQARIDPGTERLVIDAGRTRAAGAIAGVVKAVLAIAAGSDLAEVSASGAAGGAVNLLVRTPGTSIASPAAAGTGNNGSRAPAARPQALAPSTQTPAPSSRVRPSRATEPASRPPVPASSAAAPGSGEAEPVVFAFSGDDPASVAAVLKRIAEIVPNLSGRERADLACQLGRQQPAGRIRAAFAADPSGDPGELAERARHAARLLAGLPAGVLRSHSGAFAGSGVRGRAVLLFPGGLEAAPAAYAGRQAEPPAARERQPDAPAAAIPGSVAALYRGSSAALRWLEGLGVTAAAAIGHGAGELTALAWAGCMSGQDAGVLAGERDRIVRDHRGTGTAMLNLAADAASCRALCEGTELVIAAYNGPRAHLLAGPAGHVRTVAERAAAKGIASAVIPAAPALHSQAMAAGAAAFRDALGKIRFGPPRRRVISTVSGREVGRLDSVPSMLVEQFTAPVRFLEAVRAAAREADLFCAAAAGGALARLASECCPLPAVTVLADADPSSASAAAALFAAGAITALDPLFGDRPIRPVNFLREQVLISRPAAGPAENGQSDRYQDETSSKDNPGNSGNYGEHLGKRRSGPRTLDGQGLPASPEAALAPRRSWTMTVPHPTGSERGVNARMPDVPRAGPPEKAGPWARCFAEVLHPLGDVPRAAGGAWRIRVAGQEPRRIRITDIFRDLALPAAASAGATAGPAAEGVLCYVPDPAGPGAADALLAAAEEAPGPGRLVVITHAPGLAGFCQSLRATHPRLGVTLLRVPESAAGVHAARRFAAADPGTFRELVLTGREPPAAAAVSIEPVLSAAPGLPAPPAAAGSGPGVKPVRWRGAAAASGAGITAIGRADSILITVAAGDADGTGLACAEALGRTGAAVALIGPGDPAGQLQAGLGRLRAAGVLAGYEAADLTAADETAEAIGRLEERLGRVTAIVHARGASLPAPGRSAGSGMDAVIGPLTGALSNVLGAVDRGRLRLMVTFGQVAGHDGLPGGERHMLASGALRSYAERLRGRITGCRVLHVDWPSPTGMDAGRMLMLFLTTADAPDAIIVHEPGDEAGTQAVPGAAAGTQAAPPAAAVTRAEPPAPERPASRPDPVPAELRGRFLELVLAHEKGSELVAEARLSQVRDPYLADHGVDGITELPTVMGLEAMAEAASALAGRPLSQAVSITLAGPVLIPGDRPGAVRLSAHKRGDAVEAVLRSADTGYKVDHLRAIFPLGTLPPEVSGQSPAVPRTGDGAEHLLDGMTGGIVDGTELYGPLRFPAGRFRRVAFLPALTSRSCRALLRGTDDQPWFGPGMTAPSTPPLVLGSPGVNDAAMHVLQACVPHRKVVPVGCESLRCSGKVVSGAVEVRATERFRGGAQGASDGGGGGEYVWDVQAVDTDGRPVASWTGLRLRDAGPLQRDEPWSPMLLAVYLERGVAALGLDPELRITVRAGHPRQAAGIPVRSGSSGSNGVPGATGNVAREVPGASETAPPAASRQEAVAGIYAIASGPAATGGGAGGGGAQLGSVLYPAAGAGGRARRSHLDGLTLIVDGAFPAACEWDAADGGRNADGSEKWADDLGPGFGALRRELLEHCDEPAALVDARIWTAAQCLSKAGRRSGQRPLVGETGAEPGPGGAGDGRWVLLRSGDAAIASTIVEIAGISGPVAVAIMARDAAPAGQPC